MANKNGSSAPLILEVPVPTFADYVDGIRIPAAYMKPIANGLANSAPDDLSPAAKKQLGVIRDVALHGDDVLDVRDHVNLVRPTFLELANAWGALGGTLMAKARLPASTSDKGKRAQKLVDVILPEGMSFVKRDAHAAWAESDRRVRFIEENDLEAEIIDVVGEDELAAVKAATTALGEGLGVGKTKRETSGANDLQVTVARFSREVARYARMLAAEVDVTDGASVMRFRRAVAEPIDALRSRRGAADEAPVDEGASTAAPAGEASAPVASPSATANGAASPTANGAAAPSA
jgi:hypothetical protein